MSLVQGAFEACQKVRPIQPSKRPIFRLDCPDDAIFFTPGYLGLVCLPDADQFERMLTIPRYGFEQPALVELRGALVHQAEAAMTTRRRWQTAPFRPECLTLYLSNQCNLRCLYCYADAGPHASLNLEINTIRSAASLVAKSCREKNCVFTIVFHGGGEPALDRDFAEQVLTMLDEVAQAYQVPTFRYVATNGAISKDKAIWLARRFDLVGLSCDGPPDIQNYQRPGWGGGETAHLVEQIADVLHEQGCRFHVRTTITKMTLHRQVEIVDYLCRQLSPSAIHLEPLYHGDAAKFDPTDAADFVAQFLQAQARAAQDNVPLLYAGSRLNSIYGPYCQIFRDVLNLVPGGIATACFKATTATEASQNRVVIGDLNRESGQFVVNDQAIEDLRQSLIPTSSACLSCFNQFHCVGECPDRCLLVGTDLPGPDLYRPGFRCRIQKALAMVTLLETAEKLRAEISGNVSTDERKSNYGYAYGTPVV
jgi:uncharacterized protein